MYKCILHVFMERHTDFGYENCYVYVNTMQVCVCALASLSLLGPTCVPDQHYTRTVALLGPDLRPNKVFH